MNDENRLLHPQIKKHIERMSFSDTEVNEEEKRSSQIAIPEIQKDKKVAKEGNRLQNKEIPNFAGEMYDFLFLFVHYYSLSWVKFKSDLKWKKYYGAINECFLNLHSSMVVIKYNFEMIYSI